MHLHATQLPLNPWTYGPITRAQHRTARLYALATHQPVESVPGYWIMPPLA